MNTQPDTYQRILESARDLFYASSYADVGVAAICDKANVKKGSFYHYFPSKQDLTLAVLDTFYLEFKQSILDKAFDNAQPPAARLEKFIELVIEMQNQIHSQTGQVYGCPFGNLATELSTQDETIRLKLEKLFHKLQGLIRETLQAAVETGDIEISDPDMTAKAILAYFEGTMLLAKTNNDPEILRQLLPAAGKIRI